MKTKKVGPGYYTGDRTEEERVSRYSRRPQLMSLLAGRPECPSEIAALLEARLAGRTPGQKETD